MAAQVPLCRIFLNAVKSDDSLHRTRISSNDRLRGLRSMVLGAMGSATGPVPGLPTTFVPEFLFRPHFTIGMIPGFPEAKVHEQTLSIIGISYDLGNTALLQFTSIYLESFKIQAPGLRVDDLLDSNPRAK